VAGEPSAPKHAVEGQTGTPLDGDLAPATQDDLVTEGQLPVDDNTPNNPDDYVAFTHRGLEFQIPKDRGKWDMNVTFAMEEGQRNVGTLILLANSVDRADLAAVRQRIYRGGVRTADEWDSFQGDLAAFLNKHCTG
jgi:hypothetical protein